MANASLRKRLLAGILCATLVTSAGAVGATVGGTNFLSTQVNAVEESGSTTPTTDLAVNFTFTKVSDNSSKVTSIAIGDSVKPIITTTGGDGKYTTKVEVKHSTYTTWKEVCKDKDSWIPTKVGTYTVRVTVTDGTGKTATKEKSISIKNCIPGTGADGNKTYVSYDFTADPDGTKTVYKKAYYSYVTYTGVDEETGEEVTKKAAEFRGFVGEFVPKGSTATSTVGTTVKIPSSVIDPKSRAVLEVRNIKYLGHTDAVKNITTLYLPVTVEVLATDSCQYLGANLTGGTNIQYYKTSSVGEPAYTENSRLYYIGDKAFLGAHISNITLYDKVKRIRYNSFEEAKITNLILKDGFNVDTSGGTYENPKYTDISPNVFRNVTIDDVVHKGATIKTVTVAKSAIVTDAWFKDTKAVVKASTLSYFYLQHDFGQSGSGKGFTLQVSDTQTTPDVLAKNGLSVKFVDDKTAGTNYVAYTANEIKSKDIVGYMEVTNKEYPNKKAYIPINNSSVATSIPVGSITIKTGDDITPAKDMGSTGTFTMSDTAKYGFTNSAFPLTFKVYKGVADSKSITVKVKNGNSYVDLTSKYRAYLKIEQANGGKGSSSVTGLKADIKAEDLKVLYKGIELDPSTYTIDFENLDGGRRLVYDKDGKQTDKTPWSYVIVNVKDNDYCKASTTAIKKPFVTRVRIQDSIIKAKDSNGDTITLYDGTTRTEAQKTANDTVQVKLKATGNAFNTITDLTFYTWGTKDKTASGGVAKVDFVNIGNTRFICSAKSTSGINEKGEGTLTLYIKGNANGTWLHDLGSTSASQKDADTLVIEIEFTSKK